MAKLENKDIIESFKEKTLLGLKESKGVVDAAPTPIKENIKAEEAEAIKEMLEEAGAVVTVK
jgi:large subunit ribosomal protein L7/L12